MTTTIDSTLLFIPVSRTPMRARSSEYNKPLKLSNLQVLDARVNNTIISYYDHSGEVQGIKHQQPYTHQDNGITTGYRILKQSQGPSTVTGLSLALTSKILKDNYLQGISTDNIKQVYDNLISQGLITLDYSEFLNAQVMMVDIKQDHKVPRIQDSFSRIHSKAKKGVPIKVHPNGNLTIGTRNRANNGNLYIKFYDKQQELLTESSLFNMVYNPQCPDNLLRTEITLHRKHLKDYFQGFKESNTFHSLLQGVNDQGDTVMARILSDYFHQDSNNRAKPNDYSTDKVKSQVEELMELLFQLPNDYPTLQTLEDKVMRILQPSRRNKPIIKNLVLEFYTQQLESEVQGIKDGLFL